MICYHCGSDAVRKHGLTSNGKQRYKCRHCERSLRESPGSNAYDKATKEQIRRAYHERTSLRGLTRIFGVSRQTVTAWLKKSDAVAASRANASRGAEERGAEERGAEERGAEER